MLSFLPTIILRHRKENLKKCSLTGLENRQDIHFYTYPKEDLPSLEQYVTLAFDGPELSLDDSLYGLFLIDGSWRYAQTIQKNITQSLRFRSLPKTYQTAYPRKQTDCPNPEQGLASIEALYLAYQILNRNPSGLLDHYYWKNDFIKLNSLYEG